MPLKRYGKASSGASRPKKPAGAADDGAMDSGGAKDSASKCTDGDSLEPADVEDPFSFGMDDGDDEEAAASSQGGNSQDAWDFTSSTASTKNVSPAKVRFPAKHSLVTPLTVKPMLPTRNSPNHALLTSTSPAAKSKAGGGEAASRPEAAAIDPGREKGKDWRWGHQLKLHWGIRAGGP